MRSGKTLIISLSAIIISAGILVCIFGHTLAFAEGLQHVFKASDGVKMKLVPAGSFIMGSTDPDIAEVSKPNKVYLDSYYMDEHPVTNAQFTAFLNDSTDKEGKVKDRKYWVVIRDDLQIKERELWWPTEIGHEKGRFIAYEGFEEYPVITVSWLGADKYCQWAGKRLPTEAEWEKGARGGIKKARFPWGDALPTQGVVFNHNWDSNEDPPPMFPATYGMPNGFGLFNIAGMAWEWCSDWFAPDYYENSPARNPRGPESGEFKILRGGSWFNASNVLRVGLRNFIAPDALDETTGFRCVMDVPGGTSAK